MVRIVIFITLMIISLALLMIHRDPTYELVKEGKAELQCFIKDKGIVTIDPSKIINYDSDKGCWLFNNGWACNCKVIK